MTMVAVALSEEYGVNVVSSGRRTHTSYLFDGKKPTIIIPAVDAGDDNYLVLLRGYIDHEVGHVRFTKHEELSSLANEQCSGAGALRILSHIYEDIYVERLMGQCFPGCRRNIRKLISLIFNKQRPVPVAAEKIVEDEKRNAISVHAMQHCIWTAISQYILYRVRKDAAVELEALLPEYKEPVDVLTPGLVARLEPVLSRVVTEGNNTRANVALAKETLQVIEDFFNKSWKWRGQGQGQNLGLDLGESQGQDEEQDQEQGQEQDHEAAMAQLKWVLRYGGSSSDSVDISRATENIVDDIIKAAENATYSGGAIAHREYGSIYWKDRIISLTDAEQNEALQASAMVDAQMQSLLQTFVMNRSGCARAGKLNTNMLHRLSIGNSNVFRKKVDKQGIDTEIVLAIDMSGSMENDNKAIMASKALYAVIVSLRKLPGVLSSIIGFYDDDILDILRPYDRVTPKIKITASGCTLCGEALMQAMQRFTSSPESRKIVLMLTDGASGNHLYFEEAILHAKRTGVEFLGIGIMDSDIKRYLQEEECCVIDELRQLAPEMFRMLRNKLFGGI